MGLKLQYFWRLEQNTKLWLWRSHVKNNLVISITFVVEGMVNTAKILKPLTLGPNPIGLRLLKFENVSYQHVLTRRAADVSAVILCQWLLDRPVYSHV